MECKKLKDYKCKYRHVVNIRAVYEELYVPNISEYIIKKCTYVAKAI